MTKETNSVTPFSEIAIISSPDIPFNPTTTQDLDMRPRKNNQNFLKNFDQNLKDNAILQKIEEIEIKNLEKVKFRKLRKLETIDLEREETELETIHENPEDTDVVDAVPFKSKRRGDGANLTWKNALLSLSSSVQPIQQTSAYINSRQQTILIYF